MPITPGPRIPEATTWTEKMVTRAQSAGQAWLDGVNHPTKDPIAEAKKKKQKWVNAIQAAIADNAYEKGLASVDSSEIAASANALGAGVFTQGITARKPKIEKAITELRGKLMTHVTKMDGMPTDTIEQRKAKMIANLDGMIAIGKK